MHCEQIHQGGFRAAAPRDLLNEVIATAFNFNALFLAVSPLQKFTAVVKNKVTEKQKNQ